MLTIYLLTVFCSAATKCLQDETNNSSTISSTTFSTRRPTMIAMENGNKFSLWTHARLTSSSSLSHRSHFTERESRKKFLGAKFVWNFIITLFCNFFYKIFWVIWITSTPCFLITFLILEIRTQFFRCLRRIVGDSNISEKSASENRQTTSVKNS